MRSALLFVSSLLSLVVVACATDPVAEQVGRDEAEARDGSPAGTCGDLLKLRVYGRIGADLDAPLSALDPVCAFHPNGAKTADCAGDRSCFLNVSCGDLTRVGWRGSKLGCYADSDDVVGGYGPTHGAIRCAPTADCNFCCELDIPEAPLRHPLDSGFIGGLVQINDWNPGFGGFHTGSDVPAPLGTPFYAPADGEVFQAIDIGGISHTAITMRLDNGWCIGFLHTDRPNVRAGQRVGRGDLLGHVTDCGAGCPSHLHWTVMTPELCTSAPQPIDGYVTSRMPEEANRRFIGTTGSVSRRDLSTGRFVDPNFVVGRLPSEM